MSVGDTQLVLCQWVTQNELNYKPRNGALWTTQGGGEGSRKPVYKKGGSGQPQGYGQRQEAISRQPMRASAKVKTGFAGKGVGQEQCGGASALDAVGVDRQTAHAG